MHLGRWNVGKVKVMIDVTTYGKQVKYFSLTAMWIGNPELFMTDDLRPSILHRLQAGDESAAEELFHEYVYRLVHLARHRMSSKLQRRLDPEDVVNSAFRSFFRRSREGAFQIRESGDLWKLLAAITINKVRRQARHQGAKKRGLDAQSSGNFFGIEPEAFARDPSPQDAAILLEELERVHGMLSESQQQILELRGQGYSVVEAADKMGCTERTIYRAEERYEALLRERLEA